MYLSVTLTDRQISVAKQKEVRCQDQNLKSDPIGAKNVNDYHGKQHIEQEVI